MGATYTAKSTVPIASGPRHRSAFWRTPCGFIAASCPTSPWAATKPEPSSLNSFPSPRKRGEGQGEGFIYRDIPGLCKAATIEEIAANGWSLNPGRYVGVAPGEALSDEDFKEQLETLNEEPETLNAQARESRHAESNGPGGRVDRRVRRPLRDGTPQLCPLGNEARA